MTSQPTSPSDEDGDELRFPDHYPDNCPPNDAMNFPDEGMDAYRVVHENPPSSRGFLDQVELGRRKKEPEYLRRALSVFEDLEGAMLLIKQVPVIGTKVAYAKLLPAHGVYRWAPNCFSPKHYSWWRAEGVCGPEFFAHYPIEPRS